MSIAEPTRFEFQRREVVAFRRDPAVWDQFDRLDLVTSAPDIDYRHPNQLCYAGHATLPQNQLSYGVENGGDVWVLVPFFGGAK